MFTLHNKPPWVESQTIIHIEMCRVSLSDAQREYFGDAYQNCNQRSNICSLDSCSHTHYYWRGSFQTSKTYGETLRTETERTDPCWRFFINMCSTFWPWCFKPHGALGIPLAPCTRNHTVRRLLVERLTLVRCGIVHSEQAGGVKQNTGLSPRRPLLLSRAELYSKVDTLVIGHGDIASRVTLVAWAH